LLIIGIDIATIASIFFLFVAKHPLGGKEGAMHTRSIKYFAGITTGIGLLTAGISALADGWDPGSSASAMGSIAQTRHNLTISYNPQGFFMDSVRNDYGAICVYCHTPHGANKQIQAPLWNRTVNTGTYTIYDKPTTLMRPIGQPGPNSLTCLSCHDGTITIDSILNMPGSGLNPGNSSLANNETGTANDQFLDQWSQNTAGLPSTSNHFTLGPELAQGNVSGTCAFCHDKVQGGVGPYSAFMLGTDLRNDHPIGVQFPDVFGPGIDFNEPNVKIPGRMAFFDKDGDSHADTDEVRLYDTGDGYEVECASCHDPHGVPSAGAGTNSRFNPSFLRVNNGIAGNHAGTTGITDNGSK
jgi:hypothetical protein